MKGATLIIILLALCCSSSCAIPILNGLFGSSGGSGGFWGGFTSGLMNPVGGVSDLFNLAVNGTGSGLKEADSSQYCQAYCGECSEADFEEWGNSEYIASAADARALCEGNKSGYSGSQTAWDAVMDKTSGGCCT
jgi:hypothetical protein